MNSIFNIKIYKETFKQLKVIALVINILMLLCAIITPVSEYIAILDMIKSSFVKADYKEILSVYDMSFFYLIPFVIATPILTLTAYKFLNKRNSCDFYHSIPHKRTCIFLSIFAAVLTWICIITISTSAVFALLFKLCSKHIVINLTPLIALTINTIINSLLVGAGISLACSLTGTRINNIIVSGLILFLPRILMSVCVLLVLDNMPFLIDTKLPIFFNSSSNMLTYSIYEFLSEMGVCSMCSFDTYSIYTLVLGIILLSFGVLAFNKRKSETAGNGTASKSIQNVCRLAIGLIITLPSIILYIDDFAETETFYLSRLTFYVVNIIIAMLFMFIFDMLSTKNLKKSLKNILFTPVTIVINIVIVSLLIFSRNYTLSSIPDKEDIDCIQLCYDANYDYYYDYEYDDYEYLYSSSHTYRYNDDYFSVLLSNIEIDDARIISILHDAYTSQVDFFIDNGYVKSSYAIIPVTFCCNGNEYSRKIFLNITDYNEYQNLLSSNTEYLNVLCDFPSLDDKTTIVEANNLTTAQAEDIYSTYIEEIKENPAPYLEYMSLPSDYQYLTSSMLTFTTYIDNIRAYGYLPILNNYTKTTTKYLEYVTVSSSHIKSNIVSVLRDPVSYVYKYDELYIEMTPFFNTSDFGSSYNDNSSINYNYSNPYDYYQMEVDGIYSPEQLEENKSKLEIPDDKAIANLNKIADALENASTEPSNNTVYILNIYMYNGITNQKHDYFYYVSLPPDCLN